MALVSGTIGLRYPFLGFLTIVAHSAAFSHKT